MGTKEGHQAVIVFYYTTPKSLLKILIFVFDVPWASPKWLNSVLKFWEIVVCTLLDGGCASRLTCMAVNGVGEIGSVNRFAVVVRGCMTPSFARYSPPTTTP